MTQESNNQDRPETTAAEQQVAEQNNINKEERVAHNVETLIKETEDLQTKILDLEKVVNHLNDKLLRSLAEADNLRKRSKEELERTNKYAIANFASDLVVAVENFYLAVDNMPHQEVNKDPLVKNFAEAVVMTKKELTKIFEKNGIQRLYPLGEKFDHNYHEAITHAESDQDEGTIIQVIQAGYLINGRLIRPALVSVAKKA